MAMQLVLGLLCIYPLVLALLFKELARVGLCDSFVLDQNQGGGAAKDCQEQGSSSKASSAEIRFGHLR